MEQVKDIGQLDRRVDIYAKTISKSNTGQATPSEVLYRSTWAKVEDGNSKEEADGKIYLLAYRSYIVRYDAGLVMDAERMLVREVDGDYHIVQVKHLGRKEYLELKAIKRE